MNSKYLILYDVNMIKCLDLKKLFEKENLISIDFIVNDHNIEFEIQYQIKEVQTSSNPNILIIILRQSKDNDEVYLWDIVNNIEM